MKKTILMAAMLLASLPFAFSQDSSKVSVKLYGFVRNYLTFDSRKTYTVVGGEYNMIPFDEKWNEDHSEELNAVPSMQLQALTSRFGIDIQGPQWRNMQLSGKLEGDFGGFGTTNSILRLRLAYIKVEKQNSQLSTLNSQLLIGQDWHPLSGSIMPEVLGMAAGAPFRPHSRTPQIRATQDFKIRNSEFRIGYTAALLWQLQYMNNGPKSADDPTSTNSINFAHNALWPEAFIGFNVKSKLIYTQLGVDAQIIRPRTHAQVDGVTKKVDEKVESLTPTLYLKIQNSKIDIQFRTLLAQNTSHLNQLCGYAVTGINVDGSWNYSPIRNTISYLNIAYTTHPFKQSSHQSIIYNIFLGYMKNLGAAKNLLDFSDNGGDYNIYMKGGTDFTHLNSIYRIAPSISYNIKAFNLGLEYEWTTCTYGDIATDGSILNNDNLHQVANHRICALVKYNF